MTSNEPGAGLIFQYQTNNIDSNYSIIDCIDIIFRNDFIPKVSKVITAKEVGELLGLSPYTVYQHARMGKIPAIYPLGPPTKPGDKKPIRFILAQIEKYIKENSNEH